MEDKPRNPAGFGKRLLAVFYEILVVSIPMLLIIEVTNSATVETLLDLASILYWTLIPIFWSGYTIGKRLAGIRIVRIDGVQLGLGTMLLRNWLSGLIYVFTLGIGFLVSIGMVLFRKDKRALHDLIARTYVTTDK